jgi:hypothetical protein
MFPATHISGDDLIWLSNVIETAIENGQYIRVSQQRGRIMVARGQGAWSAPIGENNTL